MSPGKDRRPKVLIIHDSVSVARFLEGILRKGFQVRIVSTVRSALDNIETERPDLVLCRCVCLTNGDGPLLSAVAGSGGEDEIPLVVITDDRPEAGGHVLKQLRGAVDCVSQSIDPRLLNWKLRNWIDIKREMDRLRLSEASAVKECRRLESRIQMFIHDLKSQVFALRGFVKRLRRQLTQVPPEKERDETVQCLEDVSRSMEDFLMHSSAFPLGRRPGEGWEALRLDEIALEVVKQQQQLIRESGVEVRVNSVGGPPLIMGSRHRVRQVFDNLLTNAVKHMRGSTAPSVEITMTQNGKSIITRISDNGMGIPREYSEKIFTPFFRISYDGTETGSGLGLSIVKQIVESHSGRVWVESEPGNGATFTFTLPKVVAEDVSR